MTKPIAFGSLLLLTTALVPPALAQSDPATSSAPSATATPSATAPQGAAQSADAAAAPQEDTPQDQVDVSTPGGDVGGDIVVVGRYIPEPVRATPEIVSVLSSADIARTGEGDIAGALQRVTGLSVVGNGFVFVRGLGDRYSLALLNGSPLPSPEPLRRVVPLDIFPTSVIASSLVQKSYSANYPGEFGGGVINLTTIAIPKETFFNVGTSLSGNSETTARLGYTYDGSDLDFLGFDNGLRDFPKGLSDAVRSGTLASRPLAERQAFAAGLVNAQTSLLQRNSDIPANFASDVSFGTSSDLPDGRIGIIAAAGYSSTWRTRNIRQQFSADPNLAGINTDRQTVITDNRVVVNGLLGVGAEFGEHKLRWTNLYIRDTVKQGRLSVGYTDSIGGAEPVANPDFYGTPPVIEQNTNWFERQLINTQLVGEFKFGDLSVDLRGAYANTQRESPYERTFVYTYNSGVNDYINSLTSSGGQEASIAFSDLSEDLYSGAADVSYSVPGARRIVLSGGYAYTKTQRQSSRYLLSYIASSTLPLTVAQERPDYLISDYNIYNYGIGLRDDSGAQGAALYTADLEINAGYGQAEIEIVDGLRLTGGVRYEDATQSVTTGGATEETNLSNNYWLPSATVTWNFAPDWQFRVAGSKTIARPQFRELARQIYQDFEADREFRGNPALRDSELLNAEARFEWYWGRDQRVSLAGFYKKIDNPIEQVSFLASGAQLSTGFANAPEATLYGAELEVQKYVPLQGLGAWFESKRLVLIGNYTYTQSELKIDNSAVIGPNGEAVTANVLFRDGQPLTGQSDHIANVQIGLEDTDRLLQFTVLGNYSSERVTSRGLNSVQQPDIIEKPGFRLDLVMRAGTDFMGIPVEFKAEARNLTRTKYQEFQRSGANRVDINRYELGRSFSLGATVKF
ncbi:TonB-dependent receptor [Sphingobium sp. SCG-1]|uniref:TonB-dependent receptor domain-containing protein n=1 Tax=Sphingobium sp. SCG-1 TaxID=2072936 RepID=UPI000CD6A8D0|nr:TonB-dependent receptor [Sphingobium sp. SCG-1]AUW58704.1 TonB-dependent receptor [Sphingobium sp. SCG-1]